MKNKKILLMCKETYSYPLYFLANILSQDNEVYAFFFMAPECVYNKSYLNNTTYYLFKNNANIKAVFSIKKEANTFTQIINKKEIFDLEYLNYIEGQYTHFNNLNLQLMSSQFTTMHYHYRKYYKNFNYFQSCNWLILNYKCVERVFDEVMPDVILDLDDAELARQVVNEVAYFRNIDYITLDHPRFEFYKVPSTSLGIKKENDFVNTYNNFINDKNYNFEEEYNIINEYRNKSNIMPEEYINTVTSQYEATPYINIFKKLLGVTSYFFEQDILRKNLRIKKKNPYIFPLSIKYLWFYYKYELLKRKLLLPNKYFEVPSSDDVYVYMPLHLIPESTTFVKAPFYVDELSVIEAISKSLPIGWKLYVKEHQAMLGERPIAFYKKVKELHNVKLVQLNYYKDPKPWIINSVGVVTITGTSAFEAALLKKPSLVFGNTLFDVINSVQKVKSYSCLPKMLRDLEKFEINDRNIVAYIATVKKLGVDIKIKYLLLEGEKIIRNLSSYSDEYDTELRKLLELYNKAIHERGSD